MLAYGIRLDPMGINLYHKYDMYCFTHTNQKTTNKAARPVPESPNFKVLEEACGGGPFIAIQKKTSGGFHKW